MLVAAFLHWHSPALDDHHRKPDFVSPLVAGKVVERPGLTGLLASCHVKGGVKGTLTLDEAGRPTAVTTSPPNPCVERRLERALRLEGLASRTVGYDVTAW